MLSQTIAAAGRTCFLSPLNLRCRGSGSIGALYRHAFVQGRCPFSTTTDWSVYYHIEANNAARQDATQLTVSGPDIDGILASMTVALAVRGCSLVELHAAKSVDTASLHRQLEADVSLIRDVFYVVDRMTGDPFGDEELEPLAKSLLESLKTPMNLVGVGGLGMNTGNNAEVVPSLSLTPLNDDQIKIVKSTDKK